MLSRAENRQVVVVEDKWGIVFLERGRCAGEGGEEAKKSVAANPHQGAAGHHGRRARTSLLLLLLPITTTTTTTSSPTSSLLHAPKHHNRPVHCGSSPADSSRKSPVREWPVVSVAVCTHPMHQQHPGHWLEHHPPLHKHADVGLSSIWCPSRLRFLRAEDVDDSLSSAPTSTTAAPRLRFEELYSLSPRAASLLAPPAHLLAFTCQ